jgi:hypothetical protein
MLVDFYNKPPDKINETQLQDYFLHRRNVDKWSREIGDVRAGIALAMHVLHERPLLPASSNRTPCKRRSSFGNGTFEQQSH